MRFFRIKKDCLAYTHAFMHDLAHDNPSNAIELEENFDRFSLFSSVFLALYDTKSLPELLAFLLLLITYQESEPLAENLWEFYDMHS